MGAREAAPIAVLVMGEKQMRFTFARLAPTVWLCNFGLADWTTATTCSAACSGLGAVLMSAAMATMGTAIAQGISRFSGSSAMAALDSVPQNTR